MFVGIFVLTESRYSLDLEVGSAVFMTVEDADVEGTEEVLYPLSSPCEAPEVAAPDPIPDLEPLSRLDEGKVEVVVVVVVVVVVELLGTDRPPSTRGSRFFAR